MRTPISSLIAATLLFGAAPALAHDGDGAAADDGGAINCPLAAPAPVRHHFHAVRHVRHAGGGCPTRAAVETHRRMAWVGGGHGWAPPMGPRSGENEYGRQNFGWAPTGPGDERPGPSTWRPGLGLYGAPPAPPGYAERGDEHHGFDQRDQGEREFSERFGGGEHGYGDRGFDRRGEGERGYGDRFANGGYYGYGGGEDLEHRGLHEHGAGAREFAFGYSREDERSWSSQSGGVFMERHVCHCEARPSATDQYGFLTWPGKTHFWHGRPADGAPAGPPPGAAGPDGAGAWDDGRVIVHP